MIQTRGIFDSRHFEAQRAEGEVWVSDLVTIFAIDLAKSGSKTVDGTVVVRETTYRIANLRPDGQGLIVADLKIVP